MRRRLRRGFGSRLEFDQKPAAAVVAYPDVTLDENAQAMVRTHGNLIAARGMKRDGSAARTPADAARSVGQSCGQVAAACRAKTPGHVRKWFAAMRAVRPHGSLAVRAGQADNRLSFQALHEGIPDPAPVGAAPVSAFRVGAIGEICPRHCALLLDDFTLPDP